MANIYGTCGAWKSVLEMAGLTNATCDGPEQLAECAGKLKRGRALWRDDAVMEIEGRIYALQREVPQLGAAVGVAVERVRREVDPQIRLVKQKIEACEGAKWFVARWYFRLTRLPGLRKRLSGLESRRSSAGWAEEEKLTKAKKTLAGLQGNPEAYIRKFIATRKAMLARMQQAINSPEHAGAEAELTMARILAKRLPDSFHVFHDVRVETGDWVYVDGEHRRSAQIDHVVVGPGGVFVLEDKRWSKAFSDRGAYYDPYRQVKWAGMLLHLVLRYETRQSVRVREVLVSRGKLPPKPKESFAKIARPGEVCGYLQWFKAELDPQTLNAVVTALRCRC